MAFEGLTEKLQGALRKLSSKGKLTEDNVKEGMREVRMALLEADVNYAVAKDFIKKVTARCVGTEITGTLSASQQVIKIVNEELTQLMGGQAARLASASRFFAVAGRFGGIPAGCAATYPGRDAAAWGLRSVIRVRL